jgi:hypothetical protein
MILAHLRLIHRENWIPADTAAGDLHDMHAELHGDAGPLSSYPHIHTTDEIIEEWSWTDS